MTNKSVTVIDNSENNKTRDVLEKLSEGCNQINIAVAYFSELNLIKKWINDGIKINVIFALQPPTNPETIRYLLHLPLQVELKFIKSQFHSKVYIFYKNNEADCAVVGSSNFTQGGLINNIETNLNITDKNYLLQLKTQFIKLWTNSPYLSPKDIEDYKKYYDKFKKQQKIIEQIQHDYENTQQRKVTIIENINLCNEAKEYQGFWDVVDDVKLLVEEISKKEWPHIPVYLTIDHFWHYVKVIWDHAGLESVLQNPNIRDQKIPTIFKEFAAYDKTTENYTEKMYEASKKMTALLSPDNIMKLNEDEADFIYKNLHSGGQRSVRFTSDIKFALNNNIVKIRKSLNYLLWSEDDIALRIHKLLKDPDYKLTEFGSSGIQELLGWVNPDIMPIRNQKADYAVELLGYKFR